MSDAVIWCRHTDGTWHSTARDSADGMAPCGLAINARVLIALHDGETIRSRLTERHGPLEAMLVCETCERAL